ncbi:MAG: hypothetical protein WCF57_02055 [Pyrinomonadaceae bacterium]
MTELEISDAVSQALRESGYGEVEFKLTPVLEARDAWFIDFDEEAGISEEFSVQVHPNDTVEDVRDRVREELVRLKSAS